MGSANQMRDAQREKVAGGKAKALFGLGGGLLAAGADRLRGLAGYGAYAAPAVAPETPVTATTVADAVRVRAQGGGGDFPVAAATP